MSWCLKLLDEWSKQFCFSQWVVWTAFIQLIDILPQVTSKCIDCRWLGFLGIRLAFFHLMLVAEVLCWVLFSKLISSSQLLEPQHVHRACSLPELLSFAATVISKTSHHSAWGTWEMKMPPSARSACLRLTVVVFPQANVSWGCVQRVSCFMAEIFCWSSVTLSCRSWKILLHSGKRFKFSG